MPYILQTLSMSFIRLKLIFVHVGMLVITDEADCTPWISFDQTHNFKLSESRFHFSSTTCRLSMKFILATYT